MNTNQAKSSEIFKITGNWAAQSRRLKSKYEELTDADLKLESGKDNELLGRVENRLKKKREEVIKILKKNQLDND